MTDTPTSPLVFIDTETTGLDPRIHQPWEVCWWREDRSEPQTRMLKHDLRHADPRALALSGYWTRNHRSVAAIGPDMLARDLAGCTLVAANPAFDAAMLTRFLGIAPWHYRMIDVSAGAMWVFGWDRPRSLADTAAALRDLQYDIPTPDHTAEGDVRCVRAVYDALRDYRDGLDIR